MKILFTATFIIFIYNILLAQTSQEEYNYLTKGYKIQIESGLDMKKGYRLEDLIVSSTLTPSLFVKVFRNCQFKALYRQNEQKPCAILCIFTNTNIGLKDYFCIPSIDASDLIWEQFFKQVKTYYDIDDCKSIIIGLAKLSSNYATAK